MQYAVRDLACKHFIQYTTYDIFSTNLVAKYKDIYLGHFVT